MTAKFRSVDWAETGIGFLIPSMSTLGHGARSPRVETRFACRYLPAIALVLGIGFSGPSTAQGVACPAPLPDRLFLTGFEALPGGNLEADGPFSVTTSSGTVLRQARSIPWIAQVPVGAAVSRPMVVLVPGAAIPLGAYESLAHHLATHGFIAVRAGPQFDIFAPNHVEMALDLRAVLDSLLVPSALPAAVDNSRIAAGGHSLGGKISIMAAADDARIRALLLLDPVNSDGLQGAALPNIVPQPMASISIPIGVLGQLTDTAGAMACTPASLNYQVLFNAAIGTPRGYEWTIPGAAHFDFVSDPDQCGISCSFCLPPTTPSEQTRAFIRAVSLAFLRTYLDVDQPACEWLTGELLPAGIVVRQRILP